MINRIKETEEYLQLYPEREIKFYLEGSSYPTLDELKSEKKMESLENGSVVVIEICSKDKYI